MITYKKGRYAPKDSMSELICSNYPMLLVMGRFGIDLGFGEASIEEACVKSGVDTYTFLTVVNTLLAENSRRVEVDYARVSMEALIQYLHNAHTYFLEYRLPAIREKLNAVIDVKDAVSVAIINYYDEYLAEVRNHMMNEEERLFPYVEAIARGEKIASYSSGEFSKHHDRVEAKLSEFKNIIIKYYPAKSTNELNSVLYDIFSCERDLASHNTIENLLLVPTIKYLESK